MEKIRIKVQSDFDLYAWKDKIQFIELSQLLAALNVEYIPEVIEYIEMSTAFNTSVYVKELPEKGECKVIPITKAIALLYWLPEKTVKDSNRDLLCTYLTLHLETYLEFFDWKLNAIEKLINEIESDRKEHDAAADEVIKQQDELIALLQKELGIKTR